MLPNTRMAYDMHVHTHTHRVAHTVTNSLHKYIGPHSVPDCIHLNKKLLMVAWFDFKATSLWRDRANMTEDVDPLPRGSMHGRDL